MALYKKPFCLQKRRYMPAGRLVLYGEPSSPVITRILERIRGKSLYEIDLRGQQRIKCPVATLVDPKYKVRLHASGEQAIVSLALGNSSGRKLILASAS